MKRLLLLSFLFLASTIHAQTHVAMRVHSTFGSKGGGIDEMIQPQDVALDATGHIYVADTGNDRILKFDHQGRYVSEVGGFGWEDHQFNRPVGIASSGLELFVADGENQRIKVLSQHLRVAAMLGGRETEDGVRLGRPGGIAASKDGDIFVTDVDLDQVIQIGSFSRTDRTFGGYGYGAGDLRSPGAIDVNEKDVVAVCDTGNNRVVLFDRFGNYMRAFGEEALSEPRGVAFGANDILFVSDTSHNRVVAFDILSGQVAGRLGGPRAGDGPGSFAAPTGIAVDVDGETLLVADAGNHRIVKLKVLVLRK